MHFKCLHVKWLEVTKIATGFVEKIKFSQHTSNYKAFYFCKRHGKTVSFPHCENVQALTSAVGLEQTFCVCFGKSCLIQASWYWDGALMVVSDITKSQIWFCIFFIWGAQPSLKTTISL